MGDLRAELEGLDAEFEAVPMQQGGLILPEDRYQFELGVPRSGVCVTKDKDGATRARIMLTVRACSNPKLVGRKTSKSWTLTDSDGRLSEQGVSWLKRELTAIGLNYNKLSELGEVLLAANGIVIDATLVVKPDGKGRERENIYFNALASPAAKDADGGSF